MPRINIVENVRGVNEPVTTYRDLENHHPSKELQERSRVYANVGGESEEILGNYAGTAVLTPGGNYMVSKDMVLKAPGLDNSEVPIPSPAAGVIGTIDRADGIITINDPATGDTMFQIRHAKIDPNLKPGDTVEYGQPLGLQHGFNNGDPQAFGDHVHFDVNTRYIAQADRWIRDMSDGTITTDQRPPAPTTNIVTDPPTFVPISGNFPRPADPPLADGRLTQGEVGPEVQRLQNALNAAGARDAQGNALTADGDFGRRTFEAVQNYQQTHGMPVTGIADAQLLVQLGVVPAQQAPVQPSPTEQSQHVSPNLLPKQQDPTTNTPVLPQQAPPAEQPQHQSLQNQPSTQWPQHQPPIQPSQQQDQASKSPGQSNITEANQPKLLTDATHPKNERFEQVMKAFETLPAGTFKSDQDRATKAAEAAAESLVGERKLDKVESAKVINGTIYLGDKPNIADPAGHLAFLPLAVNKSIEQTSAAVNAVYATQDKSNEVKADQKAQDKVPDPTLTNPMLEPKQKVYMA